MTIINGDIDDDGIGDGTVVSCVNNETARTVLDGFTIAGGRAGSGGGMLNNSGSPTVTDCIVWDNDSPGVDEIDGMPAVTYSDVRGGFEGEGNINRNPMFVDPDRGDFHLSAGSPGIDAADNTAVLPDEFELDGDDDTDEPIPLDLDGNPRFVDDPATMDTGNGDPRVVDMGTFELQNSAACPWDLDGNGDVDFADLLILLAQWGSDPGGPPDFDGNGVVDFADVLELLVHWGACP